MTEKKDGATTIYNVLGDNARWNVNSPDNSVNIVTKSSDEFFADLRERIASGVPQGEEQKMILQKLDALKEANGKPSFAQTYTDFMRRSQSHRTAHTLYSRSDGNGSQGSRLGRVPHFAAFFAARVGSTNLRSVPLW